MTEAEKPDLTSLAVQLLSAYVSNNTVPSNELAGLIHSTKAALAGDPAVVEPTPAEHVPATTVRKSLASPDHIVSMIDGKPYKTLKRHLSSHGLTPAEYRDRYKLPNDYPMVAPGYSEHRRAVAQRLGLGRKPATAPASAEAEAPPIETEVHGNSPAESPVVAADPDATPTADVPAVKSARMARKKAGNAPTGASDASPKPARARRAKDAANAPAPAEKPKSRRGRKAPGQPAPEAS